MEAPGSDAAKPRDVVRPTDGSEEIRFSARTGDLFWPSKPGFEAAPGRGGNPCAKWASAVGLPGSGMRIGHFRVPPGLAPTWPGTGMAVRKPLRRGTTRTASAAFWGGVPGSPLRLESEGGGRCGRGAGAAGRPRPLPERSSGAEPGRGGGHGRRVP